jgi:hypothetical protein
MQQRANGSAADPRPTGGQARRTGCPWPDHGRDRHDLDRHDRQRKAFTVTVGPQTAFGTKAAPTTVAQFPVGATVRVTGTRNGGTVSATRIALAKAQPTATPTPAT